MTKKAENIGLGIVWGLMFGLAIGVLIYRNKQPAPANAHPVWVTNINGTKVWSD